jgi:hypothetical protein
MLPAVSAITSMHKAKNYAANVEGLGRGFPPFGKLMAGFVRE